MPVQPVLGMEVPLNTARNTGGGGGRGVWGGGGSGSAVGGELRLLGATAAPGLGTWSRSRHRVLWCTFPTTEESRKQRPCGWSLVEKPLVLRHPAQVLLLPLRTSIH